jgi:transcriptional regulator with XRE-family HTH domain
MPYILAYTVGMKKISADPAMQRARELFEKSGKTLDQLGNDMGYKGNTVRQSAWQFLEKTTDPRLSMLRRFAKAMGVPVAELVGK